MPRPPVGSVLVALLFLAPLFATLHAGASGPSCTPGEPLAIDASTGRFKGVAIGIDEKDPSWTSTRRPVGSAGGSNAASLPAYGMAALPHWAQPPMGTSWITYQQSPLTARNLGIQSGAPLSVSSDNGGTYPVPYEYTFRFTLDLWLYDDPRVSFAFAAKDTASFVLNGEVIAPQPPDASLALRSVTYDPAGAGAFVNGTNVLVARVISSGTHTGFVLSGIVEATCAPRAAPLDCTGVPVLAIDVRTGINAIGQVGTPEQADRAWRVVSYPTEPAWGPLPARVIQPHQAWVPIPGAAWVNPWPAWMPMGDQQSQNMGEGGTPDAPTGNEPYVYELRFDVNLTRYPGASLNLTYAADDGVAFELNGNPLGGTASHAFQQVNTLVYRPVVSTFFVDGENVLRALVTNGMLYTGLIVGGSVSGTCGVPPLPCAAGTSRTFDLATGSDGAGGTLAPGAPDARWRVALAPGQVPNVGPAHVIRQHPLFWVAPPASAAWVNPWSATGIPLNDQEGGSPLAPGNPTPLPELGADRYTYETRFALDLVHWKNPRIVAHFAADEREVEWTMRGTLVGGFGPNAADALHPVVYDPAGNGAFVDGENVLSIRLRNVAAWTGLMVFGAVHVDCAT